MQLYNTLTHKKEEFIPREAGKVSMYTCGPTVYHYAHIGNLRSYIMEDILEKYLRFTGLDVKRVMNITDVGHLTSDGDTGDDKMLKGAKREHKTVMEIAKFYTDAFFADCKKLNIKTPDVVEPATSCISDFIRVIESLIEKGFAYEAGGNIYFDTSKLEKYYVFNDFKEEDLAVGVREGVEEDSNKRNKADFVLWFTKSKFDDQELKWESPWGVGYPGWHIECSCISMKHLGEYLDIHCGGIDNAFPHQTIPQKPPKRTPLMTSMGAPGTKAATICNISIPTKTIGAKIPNSFTFSPIRTRPLTVHRSLIKGIEKQIIRHKTTATTA